MHIDGLIRLLVRIFHLILDFFQKYQREQDYEERQDEREKIEENPADWFGEHFPGDRVQLDLPDRDESDASETDKADD